MEGETVEPCQTTNEGTGKGWRDSRTLPVHQRRYRQERKKEITLPDYKRWFTQGRERTVNRARPNMQICAHLIPIFLLFSVLIMVAIKD